MFFTVLGLPLGDCAFIGWIFLCFVQFYITVGCGETTFVFSLLCNSLIWLSFTKAGNDTLLFQVILVSNHFATQTCKLHFPRSKLVNDVSTRDISVSNTFFVNVSYGFKKLFTCFLHSRHTEQLRFPHSSFFTLVEHVFESWSIIIIVDQSDMTGIEPPIKHMHESRTLI